jgi:hypothetical protein
MKRARTEDRKVQHEVLDAIKRQYGEDLMDKDGIVTRPDGGLQLRFRKHFILTKSKLDKLREQFDRIYDGFVRMRCEGGRIVMCMERMYPEKSYARRVSRESSVDPYWKYLDLDSESGEVTSAGEMWSNELALVPEFGPKTVLIADAGLNRLRLVVIVKT